VTLRREWCLRLGRAVVTHFSHLCAAHKRQLAALASSPELPEAEPTVSPSFLQPLEYLAAQLGMLGSSLDADSFRAVWKLVALALNRSLFNDVATEARFSAQGAAQFAADCGALVGGLHAAELAPRIPASCGLLPCVLAAPLCLIPRHPEGGIVSARLCTGRCWPAGGRSCRAVPPPPPSTHDSSASPCA
jgi:hypothetical protein